VETGRLAFERSGRHAEPFHVAAVAERHRPPLDSRRDAVARHRLERLGVGTEGRPRLTDLVTAPGFSRESVLALAGAVEARSEHPVARAIAAAARDAGAPCRSCRGR
jgi:hypothetical protein